MRATVPIAILALATLAGCLSDPARDDVADDAPDVDPVAFDIPVAPDQASFMGTILNDHATGDAGHIGHQVSALHTASAGLDLVAYSDLQAVTAGTPSGFTELHVITHEETTIGVVSSLTGSRGATLVDLTDAAQIRVLSHITNLDDNWDARLSEDLQYLFLGCQGSQAFDCTGIDDSGEMPGVTGGGPCVPLQTCPGGIAVYAIAQPSQPAFLGYLPMGFTHNVYTFLRDEVHYFINAVGSVASFDPATSEFTLLSQTIEAGHDIAVQKHPLTGQWLLYTGAAGYMSIWDLADPAAPTLVGQVDGSDYETPPPAMWHEQTPMPCLLDGRHITIGAGERGSGEPEAVGVVDTTDPTSPVYLGAWKIPDFDSLTGQMNYRFSLHNVDGNCQGQVAVGHYHAGVWVFDVSTKERQAEPVTLGFYQPHETPLTGWSPIVTAPIGALVSGDTPNVWTAQWAHDGATLYVPDMTTGLYALQPTWEWQTHDPE